MMQIRLDPMKIKIPLAHFLYVYRGFIKVNIDYLTSTHSFKLF